ncbi:MAG: FAD-dependent oxidoreductase [Myxococcota bacterium]|nr:FAD-dependent oxidoreductase [Myxococcota bacterium]
MPPASAPSEARPCVAVIGGATAGAEVAGRLAERGATVVVFEMNSRPYGKIEDGLPRWHQALRNKEYEAVCGKLGQPNVHFVPETKIGRDIDFKALASDWGFTSVVLANGAWRDRGLPIEGIDDYVGKGLVYQNPFIIWFNHNHEAGYSGQTFETPDNAIVVGGGLASIDVVKVLMLQNTMKKLTERGIEVDLVELEVKGIPKTLKLHDMEMNDLELEGPTLYYRRRVEDMPLMEAPPGADAKRIEKVEAGRARMVGKAQEKYGFKIEPLCSPKSGIVEGDQLVGIEFVRNVMKDGRPTPTDETFEVRGPVVISSIGSIPEAIDGIPMNGELFDFQDWDIGRIEGFPTLFSVGNVVTGKGNIVASRKHAAHVSETAIEKFLGISESGRGGEEVVGEAVREAVAAEAEAVAQQIEAQSPASPETIAAILERVDTRQQAIGYENFGDWMSKVTPE